MSVKINEKAIKERIAKRIDVDGQLKKIYYDANPVISLPSAQRNFEVTSQAQQSEEDNDLLRQLTNKPLTDDVTGTTPGTREIHTNTPAQDIQPKRSQNGAILSNEDKIEPLLDISMTSIKYKVNDFKNIVNTEFEEFTPVDSGVNSVDSVEDLANKLAEAEAVRDGYLRRLEVIDPAFNSVTDLTTLQDSNIPTDELNRLFTSTDKFGDAILIDPNSAEGRRRIQNYKSNTLTS